MNRLLLLSMLVCVSTIAPTSAQDFEAGQRAFRAQDYVTAIREWTSLANAGNVRAQFNLAEMYAEGRGVEKDIKQAADWYRMAAEQDYVRAQVRLGELYEAGRGFTEARKWYLKAAEQGVARAQYTLARMYWSGRGVTKDYAEAAKWYRKSADQDYAKAQSSLGYLYMQGQGVPKSSKDAARDGSTRRRTWATRWRSIGSVTCLRSVKV